MNGTIANRHAVANLMQTVLLVGVLLALSGLAGYLLFGRAGLWGALGSGLLALILEPAAASRMTLALYGARPLGRHEAPELWRMLATLADRAGLPAVPVPHYVPSPLVNAFAVGRRQSSAIAVTDGLLRTLDAREVFGVLAHETAHIAHGDLRVMGLADFVSRMTALLALSGQIGLLLSLPALLLGEAAVNWPALLLLAFSPQLALLAQLGLSRVREFDADRAAAELTGDPESLARALVHIERVSRSWRAWLMPGWGNPEPSWLRTHPATGERIGRLREMALQAAPAAWPGTALSGPHGAAVPPRPRWWPGGLWR
ncbi:zinc metalloprotease HtpX [Pseudothauera rhizosphaerae]|uniref:Zn-dependent protease n=1 Tax=Pseudothauera rhizosphaerae TaxID=2565932 RepID=A0A4S4ABY2_9RHOO|nr:zinc metalloprotease HtpX [Pseudothauera rhizosphaerae]THF56524.1 Zn-dependent protease [Pseudothauera rhizosphaerae]